MDILPTLKKWINIVGAQGYGTRVEGSGGQGAESVLAGGPGEGGKGDSREVGMASESK